LVVSLAASAAYVDYWATNFTTSKKFNYRMRQSLDIGWKFYKGTPSGTPYQTAYSDASWHNADVPHPFDEYTVTPTQFGYDGDAWYRKTFTLPDTSAGKKVLIEFEAVMQTADVYVNGQHVGLHDNSGYTEFMFDITPYVNRTGPNVLAVKANNHNVDSIPPGTAPDYCMYGGIYRDVWLYETDSVHIPLWKQYISTPTVSTGSASVKVVTTVANDKKQAQTCTVTYVILDSTGAQVATQSAQQSVPAGGTSVFTMNSTISSPKLWSVSSPYLYKVYTTVSVGGAIIDDFWERFGVRTIVWSTTNGLLLNGARVQVIGINLHQDFGWVQNAVPTSRHYKIIEELKDAGFNAMRGSHYPRDPSFYDACDELGMLLIFEAPSSGWDKPVYPAGFWTRQINNWRTMVISAYNHPCIIGFGYFNEPNDANDAFTPYFTQMKQFADSIDPGLPRYVANYRVQFARVLALCSFFGANYYAPTFNPAVPVMNTEYIGNASAWRGDSAGEESWSQLAWTTYMQYYNQQPRIAGSFLWCLMDYWPNGAKGYVDRCHVPKRGYYMFRKNLTGKADDNFVTGTATKISLEPDLTDLRADGSDFSRIVVALRNNSGQCINSNKSVTLSFSGTSAILCGPTTITTIAGKLGVVVRASETAGATRIIATSSGLASDTITITTHAVDEAPVIASRPIGISTIKKLTPYTIAISRSGIVVDKLPAGAMIRVYTIQGSVVALLGSDSHVRLHMTIAPGVYFSRLEENGVCLNVRKNVVR
jgi:beta-galactosidase